MRRLWLVERPARALAWSDLPPGWSDSQVLVLGPLLADDIDMESFAGLQARWRGLLGQGLQREVGRHGRVRHAPGPSAALLSALDERTTLFVSDEEIAGWDEGALGTVVKATERVVVTRGALGAEGLLRLGFGPCSGSSAVLSRYDGRRGRVRDRVHDSSCQRSGRRGGGAVGGGAGGGGRGAAWGRGVATRRARRLMMGPRWLGRSMDGSTGINRRGHLCLDARKPRRAAACFGPPATLRSGAATPRPPPGGSAPWTPGRHQHRPSPCARDNQILDPKAVTQAAPRNESECASGVALGDPGRGC